MDLTWISPDLVELVKNWAVREDLESLSDHLYISYDIDSGRPKLPQSRAVSRKWNNKKFDKDLFISVLIWRGFGPAINDQDNVDRITTWLDYTLEEACVAASVRIGPCKPRRQAYWWQDSVADLRLQCLWARRAWQRAKRKKRMDTIVAELGIDYKQKRKNLRAEINRLKCLAWQELIDTIDQNPWGLPYRLVMRKLKPAAIGMTESLDLVTLRKLHDNLFPRNILASPIGLILYGPRIGQFRLVEVDSVLRKTPASRTNVPGPNGFRLCLWKIITNEMLGWVRHIFDACMRSGEFPTPWKRANLVLVPKGDNRDVSILELPKVRPICLIDDIGKAFECIISNRIYEWQVEHPESDFASN